MHLLLQTSRSPEALSGELRELLWSIDPDVPTPTLRSLESIVSGAVASPRMRARLSVAFAFAALALAGLGLYGVIASSVQQRRAEIGLRMALGASMGSVVWLFMSRGLRWTILGLIAGIAGSLLVGRTLASLLYGVSPNDAFSLLVTSGLALSVAAVAVYIPSRRAARTDPVSVLRIG